MKKNSNGEDQFKFFIKNVLDDISTPEKGLTLLTNPAGSGIDLYLKLTHL